MADNINVTPGSGKTISADDIGGVLYQRIKLTLGVDGITDGDVSSSNPMPISAASLPLPANAATETTLSLINSKITTTSNGIEVDGSGVTQPISALSLPLPTGAATETTLSSLNAKVTVVNTGAVVVASSALPTNAATETTLAALNTKVTTVDTSNVSVTSSALPSGAATESTLSSLNSKVTTTINGIKVDGSAVTQPVSGTVTANIGTTGGLALDSSLSTINTTLGSPFQAGGSIGNTSFEATQSSGANLHVNVDNFPATQPVSGTVTANQGTSPWVISGTVAATQSGTWNITDITGTVSLPTGASTSANQTNGNQKSQIVDGSNATVGPVTTISGVNFLPVTLASSSTNGAAVPTRAQLIAGSDGTNARNISTDSTGKLNINNISGTVSLPTGAATETSLAKLTQTQGSTTSGQSGPLIQAAVTTTKPSYTNNTTNALSMNEFGLLRVTSAASYQNITTATTTTVKSGAGIFKGLTVNIMTANTNSITIYDNTAASGTLIGTIKPLFGNQGTAFSIDFDVRFNTGLTIVTNAAMDITVRYI